jgi:hypothetical protein
VRRQRKLFLLGAHRRSSVRSSDEGARSHDAAATNHACAICSKVCRSLSDVAVLAQSKCSAACLRNSTADIRPPSSVAVVCDALQFGTVTGITANLGEPLHRSGVLSVRHPRLRDVGSTFSRPFLHQTSPRVRIEAKTAIRPLNQTRPSLYCQFFKLTRITPPSQSTRTSWRFHPTFRQA